ncbi:hypothetical protein T5B8_07518 [Salinisphaera sp. T5B8]|uniref:hypothetical protein n=1 Tax=Salinisphaera sp. T5B8 TaxID=1304154 RepID=UPI0033424F25
MTLPEKTTIPPTQHTKPEVFIIESLRIGDEEKDYFEGKVLYKILRMCGKNPVYYYCRTKAELELLLLMYRESGYRYLHLSCHGGPASLETTLDSIQYAEFAEMLDGLLKNRRLFVSACEAGNELFSTVVSARNKGMYSIAAPRTPIRFDHAVALWSAFYVRIFSLGETAMRRKGINNELKKLCGLFEVELHLSYYNAKYDKWNHQVINA